MTKMLTGLAVLVFSLNGAVNAWEIPTEKGEGFENVNAKQEWHYDLYPNESIWYEAGRPYWRPSETKQVAKAATPAAPAKKMAKAVVGDSDRDGVNDNEDQCPNTAARAKVNAFGCAVTEKVNIRLDVKFASGKYDLESSSTHQLEGIASVLQKHPNINLSIQGHTDDQGKETYNQWISQKRAESVKAYLVSQGGIDAARIDAKGFGESNPVADNKTADGRRENRRVEAVVQN